MNWKFVIRATLTMTAVALFFVSLLFYGFSDFHYDQPLLINDLGEFGPVMLEQQEIHLGIDKATSFQFKMIAAIYALVGALLLAATFLIRERKGERTSMP